MDHVTSAVGEQFRDFKATVCSAYVTHELRQEVEARTRRNAKQAAKQTGKHSSSVLEQRNAAVELQTSSKNAQRTKTFNFQTYKFHALGDYVSTIRRYGTSDSYSSEPVSPVYITSYLTY
jgi:hypothetical protein